MSEESKTEEPTIETETVATGTADELPAGPGEAKSQSDIEAAWSAEFAKDLDADFSEAEGGGNPPENAGTPPAAPEDGTPPAPQDEPPAATETKPDEAEAKAKALAEERAAAGRWGAEKQAYEKQLKELRAEVDALKAAGKPTEKAPEKPATADPAEITDADLDAELDEDWRDNYSREEAVKALQHQRAREERAVSKAEARLAARFEAEKAEAAKAAEAERSRAEAEAALREDVRALVPGIDALDADPKFNEYLAQPLPGTLGTRLDAAKAAIASAANGGDAAAAARAVAEIYRGFGAKSATEGRKDTRKAGVPDPSKYAVPTTSGAGAAAGGASAKTYKREDVERWVAEGQKLGDAEWKRREGILYELDEGGRLTG